MTPFQKERHALGLCVWGCGEKNNGTQLCDKHAAKNSQTTSRIQSAWLANGKCRSCGKLREGSSKTYCDQHYQARLKYDRERLDKKREHKRKYNLFVATQHGNLLTYEGKAGETKEDVLNKLKEMWLGANVDMMGPDNNIYLDGKICGHIYQACK